jgi:hypothetical protein
VFIQETLQSARETTVKIKQTKKEKGKVKNPYYHRAERSSRITGMLDPTRPDSQEMTYISSQLCTQ